MAENKNLQFGVLIAVFVVIMAVIGVLNGKISEEIADNGSSRPPVASVQSHVGEAVKTDAPAESTFASVVAETATAGLVDTGISSGRIAVQQEDVEVVYELPLKEVELPQ